MFSSSWLQLCLHLWDYTDGTDLQSAPGCVCESATKVVSIELPDDISIFDHQVPSPVCFHPSRNILREQLCLFLGDSQTPLGIHPCLKFSKLTKMLSQANTIHSSWEPLLNPQITLSSQGCLSDKWIRNIFQSTRLLKCYVAAFWLERVTASSDNCAGRNILNLQLQCSGYISSPGKWQYCFKYTHTPIYIYIPCLKWVHLEL